MERRRQQNRPGTHQYTGVSGDCHREQRLRLVQPPSKEIETGFRRHLFQRSPLFSMDHTIKAGRLISAMRRHLCPAPEARARAYTATLAYPG